MNINRNEIENLTNTESLPSPNNSLIERIDYMKNLSFTERHVAAGRLLVVEVGSDKKKIISILN